MTVEAPKLPKLTRWHWKATVTPDERGVAASQIEFHFEDLHSAAGEIPLEGHELSLRFSDPHYPLGTGRTTTRDHFITDEFRANEVRALFWSVPINDRLSVRASLAAPHPRLNEPMDQDQVIRIGYINDGHEWFVARVNPAKPGLSDIIPAGDIR